MTQDLLKVAPFKQQQNTSIFAFEASLLIQLYCYFYLIDNMYSLTARYTLYLTDLQR